jgi:hypothetical protein
MTPRMFRTTKLKSSDKWTEVAIFATSILDVPGLSLDYEIVLTVLPLQCSICTSVRPISVILTAF